MKTLIIWDQNTNHLGSEHKSFAMRSLIIKDQKTNHYESEYQALEIWGPIHEANIQQFLF